MIWFYHTVMCPKDADGMANSADPGQTTQEQFDLHLHYELQTVQTLIRLFHVVQIHVLGSLWQVIVTRLFKEKRGDTVFGFPWFRPPSNSGQLLQFYADLFETLQVFGS